MRNSSARQQEFDFSAPEPLVRFEEGPTRQEAASREQANATSNASLSRLGMPEDLYAIASKRAGRVNAASISEKDLQDLLDERQRLLDRFFNETITRKETIRLEYVRWQLDLIEDARHGAAMDMLETLVSEYERFSSDIEKLHRDLSGRKQGSRNERKR